MPPIEITKLQVFVHTSLVGWGVHVCNDRSRLHSHLSYQLRDGEVHLTGLKLVSLFILLTDNVHLVNSAPHSLHWCFTLNGVLWKNDFGIFLLESS